MAQVCFIAAVSREHTHVLTPPTIDDDKANNTLISRVCALVNMDHNSVGYTGPLSRSVLAFNGFGRAFTRELRNLTETTLVNMLMGDDAEREGRDDWSDLGLLFVLPSPKPERQRNVADG